MRFPYTQYECSICLILIFLNFGTTGQCSVFQRRAPSADSKTSISTTHSSSSKSSSSTSTSTSSTHSHSRTSTSITSTTHSHSTTSSSDTSTTVSLLTEIVEALPVNTPLYKSASTSSSNVHTQLVNGPEAKATPPSDLPNTKTVEGQSTTRNTGLSKGSIINGVSDPKKSPTPTPSSTEVDYGLENKSHSGKHTTSPTTTTPSTTYTNAQVTMTSAPNWGTQLIPENDCTIIGPEGDIEWVPCMVFAGTVQLSYFPKPSGNLTYPKTYYDPVLSMTLTSPSVYMVINTLTADNACGRLGPTYTNYVLPLDLTDVSTMQPYADMTAIQRLGDPLQLNLDDLATNCPKDQSLPAAETVYTSDGAVINPHPVADNYNRCNPRLVMPEKMKEVGLPYWLHCGNDNGQFGIFDPPGAVPPVQGLFPTTKAVPVKSTSVPANPASTAQPAAAPTNSVPVAQPEPSSSKVPDPAPAASTPAAAPAPQPNTQPASPQPVSTIPNSPTVIAVIGSNTIIAVPGASTGVVLPNGAPATVGAVTTLADSNNNPVVVSVASSGIIIDADGTKSFIANPTASVAGQAAAPTPVATVGSQVINSEPGATTLVFNGQTLTAGGEPVTLFGTNNVATLGSDGLVIQFPNGKVSTFTIPTAAAIPVALPTQAAAPADNINGIPISALPGGLGVVVGTQTISVGGPVATIPGDIVVTLAPAGLIVQKPGGVVSTLIVSLLPAASTTPVGPSAGNGLASIIASIFGIYPASSLSSSVATPQGSSTSWAITTPSPTSDSSNLIPTTTLTFSLPPGVTITPPTVYTIIPSGNGASSSSSGEAAPSIVFASAGAKLLSRWEVLWSCIVAGFVGLMIGL